MVGARLGSAEQEALGQVAAQGAQRVELLGALDPLGDGPQPEGVGQGDDRRTMAVSLGVEAEAPHEGPVDLEQVDREAATGRRATSSPVPKSSTIEADAEVVELVERARRTARRRPSARSR